MYTIFRPKLPDQLDVNVMESLVLARDSLCQDVVDEPIEICDDFLLLLLCLLFNVLILTRRSLLFDGDELFKFL